MTPNILLCLMILVTILIVVVVICVTIILVVILPQKEHTKRHEEDNKIWLKIIEVCKQENAYKYAENNRFLSKNTYKPSEFNSGTEIAKSYSEEERKKEMEKPADTKAQIIKADDLGKICDIAEKIIDESTKSTKSAKGTRRFKR